MSSQNAPAYHWLKQISPAVLQWDQVPLYGASPPFPFEELAENLKEIFQLTSLSIHSKETKWRNPESLTEGLGSDPYLLQIGISNLEGEVCWAMSKSEIAHLMEKILGRVPEDFISLDQDFFSGFYHYLGAQTFHALSALEFGKNLNPGIKEDAATLPQNPSLCLDIEISFGDQSSLGRFIVSPEALTSWKERFAERSLSTALNSPLAEKLQAVIHLEIGNVSLTSSRVERSQPGRFFDIGPMHL